MKWTQGKSDKAWEDLGNEARAILVKIIYSSYRNEISKKGNLFISLSFSLVFIYFDVNQPSQLVPWILISTLSLFWKRMSRVSFKLPHRIILWLFKQLQHKMIMK